MSTSKVEFKFEESTRIEPFKDSVWLEYSPLAIKFGSVNLGQGFPNWKPPQFVLDNLKSTLSPTTDALVHQYARSAGHINLVNAIAKKYSPDYGRKINPLTEIVVTVGASEAICTTMLALLSPGDEVILIEPFFDMYFGGAMLSQAVIRTISLKPRKQHINNASDLVLDLNELKSVMNEKTKLLIINTPHNPTGKVFTEEELKGIAEIVCQHPRCLVMFDEVYEHIIYDNAKHVRIAKIPGMYERTVTINSSGKTFSSTGWKIGWTIAPENISSAISKTHQYTSFSVSTPQQEAIALSLADAEKSGFYETLKNEYLKRRDFLYKLLDDCGLNPILPQGSFFILADASQIKLKDNEGREKNKSITCLNFDYNDWNICRWLTTDIGVTAIPCSAFYSEENASKPESQRYLRFAFCKDDASLQKAVLVFKKLKEVLEPRRVGN
eukprot:TRINITY_DN9568_c0_g1_i1.p1 TRINITY_DN9568_c0_g1~~TRINITY_DN9568_c0_g1_i1.p1  ORF type:complete len:469 (-),score=68.13 TRINITY_DN9568_c0_g1_i1:8-1327(-)